MTTSIPGDHLARLQAELKSMSDRIYELERGVKARTKPRYAMPELTDVSNTMQPTADQVLTWNGTTRKWTSVTPTSPTHTHPDYAGPTLRLSGLVAPSTNTPTDNIEYGWHFERIDYQPAGGYFTYTAGDNIITVNKAGRYLISAAFAWGEQLPFRGDYASDLDYAIGVGHFLLGDRMLHVAAAGQTVIDSHHSPSGNITSNEGITQSVLVAGATISASYWFYNRANTPSVPASQWPVVHEAGVYWPTLAVTYLGPS